MICKKEVKRKMENKIKEVELIDNSEKFVGEVNLKLPLVTCGVYVNEEGDFKLRIPSFNSFDIALEDVEGATGEGMNISGKFEIVYNDSVKEVLPCD